MEVEEFAASHWGAAAAITMEPSNRVRTIMLLDRVDLHALRHQTGNVGAAGKRTGMTAHLHDEILIVDDDEAARSPSASARCHRALIVLVVSAEHLRHVGHPRTLPCDSEHGAG